GGVIFECPLRFDLEQGTQASWVTRIRQFTGQNTKSRQVFLREVHPSETSIFFHVTDNVRELKCEPEPLSKPLCGRVFVTENVNADEAHDRRHVITVALKVLKTTVLNRMLGRILLLLVFNIHCRAESQLIKQAYGNSEPALGIDQGEKNWIVGRITGSRRMKRIDPGIETLPAIAC